MTTFNDCINVDNSISTDSTTEIQLSTSFQKNIIICLFGCATIEKYKKQIQFINETWIKKAKERNIITLFFLGEEQTDLVGENYIYLKGVGNDYLSASYKQDLGLKYIYENYNDIEFVYVAGTDVYINIDNLLTNISSLNHEKNLYIGNLYSIVDTSILSEFEIKNIIQVFDDYIEPIPTINYLRIEISDDLTTDITRYFSDFINFIKKSNNNTLIHCQHGSSRSGSFVIFYLMYFHKMSLINALEYARTKRYGINPNKKLFYIKK